MARNAEASRRAREWVVEYLQQHPCVDCGTGDLRVLTFDHRDPGHKRAEISALVANGYSLEAVTEEVAKCDVRCANCHLIRTREQRGWWRADGAEG